MKTLFTFATLLYLTSCFAQDTNYTLNGKLGIGTVPEEKLAVNGDSRLEGQLVVTDHARLMGTTQIDGELVLTNLLESPDGTLVVVNSEGALKRLSPEFTSAILNGFASCDPDGNAVWRSQPEALYPCPLESRLGLGTDSPGCQLDVHGDARVTEHLHIGELQDNETPYLLSVNADEEFGLVIHQDTDGLKSAFRVENNEYGVLEVFSNGVITSHVGDGAWNALEIKNTEGVNILEVNPSGGLTCTQLKVRMTPFPDYVFDKDYKLMTLSELEEYILKNKHLPNMPSSTVIHENGADLGELNRVLVEKTEEQALYLIQKEHEIQKLQADMEMLRELVLSFTSK